MVFFSLYPRDFASISWGKEKRVFRPASSLELIFKVVITWKDLLKNYSAVMLLKDNCRKWYFVPELILLPWAHWKILELLCKSGVSLSKAENNIEGCSDVSGRDWRRNSWDWGWPQVNVFPFIQQKPEAIFDHGADHWPAQSWPVCADPDPSISPQTSQSQMHKEAWTLGAMVRQIISHLHCRWMGCSVLSRRFWCHLPLVFNVLYWPTVMTALEQQFVLLQNKARIILLMTYFGKWVLNRV